MKIFRNLFHKQNQTQPTPITALATLENVKPLVLTVPKQTFPLLTRRYEDRLTLPCCFDMSYPGPDPEDLLVLLPTPLINPLCEELNLVDAQVKRETGLRRMRQICQVIPSEVLECRQR